MYSDSHRYLVQAMMAERQLSEDRMNEIYQTLDTEANLNGLIQEINDKLFTLDLQVKQVIDHSTCLPVFILINLSFYICHHDNVFLIEV